ncbi:S-adenosyl-L-methionine-dependent methyltransferase [Rhizophagus clarus]|uniref:S-adenosyl-L-methionine-dependent methyltransferase n=1 Tax=Rhizophagus clarus TaxID=94130 RepID=A0A8H3L011_9GLOM|nr:S-adenosyl-L-methionine-dependent methyltransferase [Rhizophagus clarus]
MVKKIPEFGKIESEQEIQEKLLDYHLRTDFSSIDILHAYHFLRGYIFQSKFSSPIEDKLIEGCKVLDIGCGPGTWLLELSCKYENTDFFGIDIKSVFPQQIKPNNLEFIKADVTNGLPFNDNEFDFTHAELMSLMFTPNQWDFVLSELIRVTKPGGYIEIADRCCGHVGRGPIFRKLIDAVWASFSKRDIDVKLINNLDSIFELHPNIGKVHRIEKNFIIGPNGGKVGLIYQDIVISHLNSEIAGKVISEEIGIFNEEYKDMVEELVEEFKRTSAESVHVRFWTQKQLSKE